MRVQLKMLEGIDTKYAALHQAEIFSPYRGLNKRPKLTVGWSIHAQKINIKVATNSAKIGFIHR